MDAPTKLLGPDGQPIIQWLGDRYRQADSKENRASILRAYTGFIAALSGTTVSPTMRASEPMMNHAWVYAAAMAFATNIAQLPLQVFSETDRAQSVRQAQFKRAGKGWIGGNFGRERSAVQRHLSNRSRIAGAAFKDVEVQPDDPLSNVLYRPNPWLTGSQMLMGIVLHLIIEGEAFLLKTGENRQPLGVLGDFAELHVLPPSAMTDNVDTRTNVVSYWDYVCRAGDGLGQRGTIRRILPFELIHIKMFNPKNPIRGLSRIAAAASGIETSLMADSHNRAVIANGANPGGILSPKGGAGFGSGLNNKEIAQSFEENFALRFGGPQNTNRVVTLPEGVEWTKIGLSPMEMDYLEGKRWTREEILAVIGVPKSALSITDDLNFATAIAQDRNFWRNSLIPASRLIEDSFDWQGIPHRPDSTFIGFDFSKVEALRAGIADQVNTAKAMSEQTLHVPPKVAFEAVGLDLPDYEGNENALVSPILVPIGKLDEVQPAAPTGGAPAQNSQAPGTGEDQTAQGDGAASRAILRQSEVQRARNDRYWSQVDHLAYRPIQRLIGGGYSQWVVREKAMQIQQFDKLFARGKAVSKAGITPNDIEGLLLPLGEVSKRLAKRFMAVYHDSLEKVFNFTTQLDMGAVPVFAIDDPRLLQFLESRTQIIQGTMPVTLQTNLRRSLLEGINASDTLVELRDRVSRVFNNAASPAKTLQVAVTETGGFVNGARDTMFKAQGFVDEEWITSLDEHVRASHEVYGAAGVKPRGFDYLTIRPTDNRFGGRLLFPHDPDAPADEIINCRCAKRPVK